MAQLGEASAINCTVSLPNSVAACLLDQAMREALSGITCSPGSVAGRLVLGSCSTVAC
jgi:hypothetical protein